MTCTPTRAAHPPCPGSALWAGLRGAEWGLRRVTRGRRGIAGGAQGLGLTWVQEWGQQLTLRDLLGAVRGTGQPGWRTVGSASIAEGACEGWEWTAC